MKKNAYANLAIIVIALFLLLSSVPASQGSEKKKDLDERVSAFLEKL